MADDWEDWEEEADAAPATAAATNGAVTKGQAALARVNEPDASKFADEDAGEETPAWEKSIPKPQEVPPPCAAQAASACASVPVRRAVALSLSALPLSALPQRLPSGVRPLGVPCCACAPAAGGA